MKLVRALRHHDHFPAGLDGPTDHVQAEERSGVRLLRAPVGPLQRCQEEIRVRLRREVAVHELPIIASQERSDPLHEGRSPYGQVLGPRHPVGDQEAEDFPHQRRLEVEPGNRQAEIHLRGPRHLGPVLTPTFGGGGGPSYQNSAQLKIKLESSHDMTPEEAPWLYRRRAGIEHLISSLKRITDIKSIRLEHRFGRWLHSTGSPLGGGHHHGPLLHGRREGHHDR